MPDVTHRVTYRFCFLGSAGDVFAGRAGEDGKQDAYPTAIMQSSAEPWNEVVVV